MPFTDRELFARLIQCEAGGEGDNGMRAVASVVMNRVNATTGEYARVGRGSLYAPLKQNVGGITRKTYTTCAQSKFIMILRTGPLRATGC